MDANGIGPAAVIVPCRQPLSDIMPRLITIARRYNQTVEGPLMKLTGYETLHCDAGWRVFSFLKLTTDEGLHGISEYNESYGSPGLSGVIENLANRLIGRDPCSHELLSQQLYAITRQACGGMTQQAIAAIENALLDIKGKALGVPVHALLGGAVREPLAAVLVALRHVPHGRQLGADHGQAKTRTRRGPCGAGSGSPRARGSKP